MCDYYSSASLRGGKTSWQLLFFLTSLLHWFSFTSPISLFSPPHFLSTPLYHITYRPQRLTPPPPLSADNIERKNILTEIGLPWLTILYTRTKYLTVYHVSLQASQRRHYANICVCNNAGSSGKSHPIDRQSEWLCHKANAFSFLQIKFAFHADMTRKSRVADESKSKFYLYESFCV